MIVSMDEFGSREESRDGETDTRGAPPGAVSMDECFQSLLTKNPNQRIAIHDPIIIKTGRAALPAKRNNTLEKKVQNTLMGGQHMEETSHQEDVNRMTTKHNRIPEESAVQGLMQHHQSQSWFRDFMEYQYTQMESKGFIEQQQTETQPREFTKVQHTYVEPNPTQVTKMEPLDLSLKKTKKKLQNGCSTSKSQHEEKESTVSGSSSFKTAAIPEFPPSSLPKRTHCRPLPRIHPYWIPVTLSKHLTLYGKFQPEFIVNTKEVDGNSRRDENDEEGRIQDALEGDHIDCSHPEGTSSSACSSFSGQLTVPQMEIDPSECNCLELDPPGGNHVEPLNEMGTAVTDDNKIEDKAIINTIHSCIPLLDEVQMNVGTWGLPSTTTQSVKHKLRDKLTNKKNNGGTKPFK